MTATVRQAGFSLIEVLMAVTTLAVGMLFVGGTFVLGVHYTTLNTEITYADIVSAEAFATIQLYGVQHPKLAADRLVPYDANVAVIDFPVNENLFTYEQNPQYRWQALLKPLGGRNVRVTVLVCRWTETADPNVESLGNITIEQGAYIHRDHRDEAWTHRNYVVAGDSRVFRVVRARNAARSSYDWELNPPLEVSAPKDTIDSVDIPLYRIAPQTGTGRPPCIAVYQKDVIF